MSHKMLRLFIVKVSVLGYFPLHFEYNKYVMYNVCFKNIRLFYNTFLKIYSYIHTLHAI